MSATGAWILAGGFVAWFVISALDTRHRRRRRRRAVKR